MFRAYFDDSGGRDTKTAVIAGYIAPVLQWDRFSEEWNEILDSAWYGLPSGTVFHMKDFAHSQGAFTVFRAHKDDAETAIRRRWLIENLIRITKVRATKSFSCSFNLADFEDVNKTYLLKESFGGPFAFAGRTCAGRVRQWSQGRAQEIPPTEIEFIFEDGMSDKGSLMTVMQRDGFRLSFHPKGRECPPLQAADLIAWEFHKVMKQAFEHELSGLRASFDALLKMPGDNGVFSNARDLLSKCVLPAGVQKRPGALE